MRGRMDGMDRYYVTETARPPARGLFEGRTIAACLEWIRVRWDGARGRPAIWVDAFPDTRTPDSFICLPAWCFDAWRDCATEVVDGWDRRWLLLESAPRVHRLEARDDLIEAIAAALARAAGPEPLADTSDIPF